MCYGSLELNSLELRRLRGNFIMVYKITRGMDKVNAQSFPKVVQSRTTGHRFAKGERMYRNPKRNIFLQR